MDEKTLTRALRIGRAPGDRPGRRCPDDTVLAAFADGSLSGEEKERVESHLADCDACLGQLAFLARQTPDPVAQVIPGAVARARDLVAARRQPLSARWRPLVVRWGTAAAGLVGGVVAVALVLKLAPAPLPQTPPPRSAPAPASQPAPATAPAATPSAMVSAPRVAPPPERSAQRGTGGTAAVRTSATPAAAFALLSPAADSTRARRDLEFRWREIPNCLYYELEVVTDDGTVVWQARVDGTRARPPADLTLEAGAKYFAWVRAYLKGGETIKSAAVPFHVGG